MASEKALENALDDCLDRLAGGDSLEECLAAHPQMAGELEPLLVTVLATKKALAVDPAPQARARVLQEINAALEETIAWKRRPFFSFQRRWAVAVASMFLVLLMAGGSVAVAAGKCMPDSNLYPLKLVGEQVLLLLSTSPDVKAQRYARLADSRVTEIVYLAQRGGTVQIESAARLLDSYLASITLLASNETAASDSWSRYSAPSEGSDSAVSEKSTASPFSDELAALLRFNSVTHEDALRQSLETAPATVQQLLREVLAAYQLAYQEALDAIER